MIPIEKQVEDETVRVNVIDEKVELTVFNPTPIELEYTVAIWGGQMFEVGTLEAYGQKTVSVEGVADVYDYLEKNLSNESTLSKSREVFRTATK